jgi:HAD superfamily hydrolase (TIGR01484 family)
VGWFITIKKSAQNGRAKKKTGRRILPFSRAHLTELSQIRGVCLDIDDTLSTRGKLTAEAFTALWRLKKSGYFVVPITGRPAGWCDHIARFWPVDAVVGENGAFTFFVKEGVRKRINTPGGDDVKTRKTKLKELAEKIRRRFPWSTHASDQSFREFDLAIDICEDVQPWPQNQVEKLLKFCRENGAHAKLSSIHVNTWFGNYDKQSGFKYWLENGAPGLKGRAPKLDQWIFIGDSPNDEPLFASFEKSVGVANLRSYIPKLKHPPRWITRKESGAGFREMVDRLCETAMSSGARRSPTLRATPNTPRQKQQIQPQ